MSRNRAQLALGPLALALFLSDSALDQGPRWVYRQGGEAHGVHFSTSSIGAIAEDGGRIRYWDDSNQVWTQAETDQASREDLKGIFFLDEDLGWAVGLGGTVLHTTDSGRNWTRIATVLDYTDNPKPAELWDILMTSTGAGWVVGSDGVIAQTANNWQTWSVPTQLQGVIAGFGGTDPEDPYDIKILFDGTIVVAADWGATYRRDPSTQLWSRIPIAVGGPCDPSGGSYLELWSLDFFPGTDDGWCVGGNGTNGGQLYQTTDGGASWTRYTQVDTLSTGSSQGCSARSRRAARAAARCRRSMLAWSCRVPMASRLLCSPPGMPNRSTVGTRRTRPRGWCMTSAARAAPSFRAQAPTGYKNTR